VQDYWDRRPCNVKHAQLPGQESNEEEWRTYSLSVTDRKYKAEPHILPFLDLGRLHGKYILDVGCGIGTQAITMAAASAYVDGIDISGASLKIANRRAWAERIPSERLAFRYDNMETLSDTRRILDGKNSGGYDIALAFGTIHHTPRPEAALNAIWEVLVPGGELWLMVYHKRAWKWLWAMLKYRNFHLEEVIPQYSEAQTGSPITYAYTKSEICSLVHRSGLVVERAWVDHIFPYQVGPYRRGEYKKTLYWQLTPPSAFRWLESKFGLHLMVEARKPK